MPSDPTNERKIKRVAILTGTRSEYGILKPLIQKIYQDKYLELKLIVTGLHESKIFGNTKNEILDDGFPIEASFKMYDDSLFGDEIYHGTGLGKGIIRCVNVLSRLKPDILLVYGDRLEALAAALAAATLRIPIGHIQAGDRINSGHIDDQIRFSITRFAHLLFASTKRSAERLIKMGEEPWRIHVVGALGLDSVISINPYPKEYIIKRFDLDPNEPYALVIFHPVIHEYNSIGIQMREILEAIKQINLQSIVIYPNNDLGSEKIISIIKDYERNLPYIHVYKNIPHELFINLMHYASVMIGNSSSGLIEAPSLGLPFVHVGTRNLGRDHGDNVIFVKPDRKEIISAIKKSLFDEEFINRVKKRYNPYGDGKTSDRIIRILKSMVINEKLLRKRLTY